MHAAGVDRVLFEAPRKDQQAWLINRYRARGEPRQHRARRRPPADHPAAGAARRHRRLVSRSASGGDTPAARGPDQRGARARTEASRCLTPTSPSTRPPCDGTSSGARPTGAPGSSSYATASGATALLRVAKESVEPLFSPIIEVELLAGPADCAYVVDAEADTAVPSALARVADRAGAWRPRGRGRGPLPACQLHREPGTAAIRRAGDRAAGARPSWSTRSRRLLAVAEDLPPMLPEPDTITFAELAARAPADRYLLPCNGSGASRSPAQRRAYLDQRPAARTLDAVGLRSIARHPSNGSMARCRPNVDMCPRRRSPATRPRSSPSAACSRTASSRRTGASSCPGAPRSTRCGEALGVLAQHWEPQWRPV